MKTSIQRTLIGAISSVVTAAITIPATFTITNTSNSTNSNTMTINMDGEKTVVTSEKYEEIIRKNAVLESENRRLSRENEELNQKSIENSANSKKDDAEMVNDQILTEKDFIGLITNGQDCHIYDGTGEGFKVGGETYNYGVVLYGGWRERQGTCFGSMNANLGGKYEKLFFSVGRIDDCPEGDANIKIWGDGEIIKEDAIVLDSFLMPFEIDVTGVEKLTVEIYSNMVMYACVDFQLQ